MVQLGLSMATQRRRRGRPRKSDTKDAATRMREYRQRRRDAGFHPLHVWVDDATRRWLGKNAVAHGLSIESAAAALLKAAAEWFAETTMARNKRVYQETFWKSFQGTWAEQGVFRIPPEERQKWIITDTSQWDERWP